MYLQHVSTGRIYRCAVLFSILLLAIPDAFAWGGPIHYTYGYPQPGNPKQTRHIMLPASYWGSVTYKTRLTTHRKITCIYFVDQTGNGLKVWMSRWPPCYNPEIIVTSPDKRNIDMNMEIYIEFSSP